MGDWKLGESNMLAVIVKKQNKIQHRYKHKHKYKDEDVDKEAEWVKAWRI